MIKRLLNLSSKSFASKRAHAELVFLREREGVFDGALNLREDRGRQSSKFFYNALFIDRFDLFSHGFRSKSETSRAFRNNHMTGGDVGGIFRQRNHNDELAEAIDAIVGHHNGRTSLFDLDADRRVKVDDHDITAPYVGHLDRLSPGSPKPRRRLCSSPPTNRVPPWLRVPSVGSSRSRRRAPFVSVQWSPKTK